MRSVEVLKEAIQGRSRWLRKAPLRLSHPQRPLLDAHRELLLFAAGSAAKEQWHTALSSACDKDRGPGAAVAALYETFCERARTAAAVPYAQVPSSFISALNTLHPILYPASLALSSACVALSQCHGILLGTATPCPDMESTGPCGWVTIGT